MRLAIKNTDNNLKGKANYFYNKFKDNPLVIGFVGLVVGALLTYIGSYGMYQVQLHNEQKNIAQAIAIDVYGTSQTLNCSLVTYRSQNNFSGEWGIYRELTPFYSDHGFYFSDRNEIYTLSPDISEDIYLYYTQVFDIERERQFIVDHYTNESELNNSTAFMKNAITGMSGVMPSQIDAALKQGNKVENELKEN